MVGRSGFEPLKSKDSGFTVRPIWPLWNLPVLISDYGFRITDFEFRIVHFLLIRNPQSAISQSAISINPGATCRNRTNDLLITNQLLYQLS